MGKGWGGVGPGPGVRLLPYQYDGDMDARRKTRILNYGKFNYSLQINEIKIAIWMRTR